MESRKGLLKAGDPSSLWFIEYSWLLIYDTNVYANTLRNTIIDSQVSTTAAWKLVVVMMELYRVPTQFFGRHLNPSVILLMIWRRNKASHRGDVQEDAPAHLFNMRQREKDRITMFVPAPTWISTRTHTHSFLLCSSGFCFLFVPFFSFLLIRLC